MHIRKLIVEGFRSLKSVEWRPGDLNVLIGPNGCGKSNVLYLLELLIASAQGGLAQHVEANGGMELLTWDGAVTGIDLQVSTADPLLNIDWLYHLRISRFRSSNWFSVEKESLSLETSPRTPLFWRESGQAYFVDKAGSTLTAPRGQIGRQESILSNMGGPFGQNLNVVEFQWALEKWSIHLGLQTGRDAPVRQAAVTRYQPVLSMNGDNLVSVLHTLYTGNREFKQALDDAMHAAFGDEYEELLFPPAADQRVQLAIRWKGLNKPRSSADMADGVLRFLYLMAILANPDPPGVVAIDEPETGLHPSMLPIVAEYAAEAATRTQVILTTHSPEFLDAFRGTEPQPMVTVMELHDGQTVLRTLSGQDLTYWLKEYTLGDMFRSGELEAMH